MGQQVRNTNYDPDGRLAFLIPVAYAAYRAYSAHDTATSTIGNARVLADASATGAQKLSAGAEIVGGLLGGKAGTTGCGERCTSSADQA
jgi:hypothetical protein